MFCSPQPSRGFRITSIEALYVGVGSVSLQWSCLGCLYLWKLPWLILAEMQTFTSFLSCVLVSVTLKFCWSHHPCFSSPLVNTAVWLTVMLLALCSQLPGEEAGSQRSFMPIFVPCHVKSTKWFQCNCNLFPIHILYMKVFRTFDKRCPLEFLHITQCIHWFFPSLVYWFGLKAGKLCAALWDHNSS